jgi:hypothetical protein
MNRVVFATVPLKYELWSSRRESGIDQQGQPAVRPKEGGRMPAHKAFPIELSFERVERPRPGAFNAAKAGGAGQDHFAGRERPRGRRERYQTGELAQDCQHLAAPLDGCGGQRRRCRAFERRATVCCVGAVRTRGDLRNRGLVPRRSGGARSPDQSLESERTGPPGGPAWYRRKYLARLGRALFKKRRTLSHIASATGCHRSPIPASTRNVMTFARCTRRRPPWPHRGVRPFRSTR